MNSHLILFPDRKFLQTREFTSVTNEGYIPRGALFLVAWSGEEIGKV